MEDIAALLSQTTQARSHGKPDLLNTEFMYFCAVLKVVAPAVSTDDHKQKVVPWISKLFRPEYHSTPFREKRNKYLLYLTLTLLNDEVHGIFALPPPDGALPDMSGLPVSGVTAAEWELDTTWHEILHNLPEDFKEIECSVHETQAECDEDHQLDKILDQEFQYLLYLAKPYAALLKGRYDSTRVATWLQTLCSIHGNACSSMRGIRNDYIMSLLGYIHDLRLIGPFAEYPPWRSLPPLAEAAKMAADNRPLTDPTGPEASEFLSSQPIPHDGAFCYIAITGDLVTSTVGPAS